MESTWAPPGFSSRQGRPDTLFGAVERLSPKAKQAFYAASLDGPIARGTWNGCAFNAGGSAIGEDVRSLRAAAVAFEMSQKDVSNFIHLWDNFKEANDVDATDKLREFLLEVGLHTQPAGKATGTFVVTVHKSEKTVEQEFDELVAQLGDPDIMNEFKEAAIGAKELLGV